MSYGTRKPQSKAETEANARTLRSLVKQPENKVCADCKRNDTRWASWNLGCFLCIRCSGIHRSMGTHISRVKSIDLDIWTPEQMESILKWGNKRANLYWEAHLKPGHVPPDHRVESFIRSKYEGRRWARQGPPPDDPSTLSGGAAPGPAAQAAPAAQAPSRAAGQLQAAAAAPAAPAAPAPIVDLLGDAGSETPSASAAPPAQPARPAAQPAASGAGSGLFDLDWAEPQTVKRTPAQPDAGAASRAKGKDEILSLFSTPWNGTSSTGGTGHAAAASSDPLASSFDNLGLGSRSTAQQPPTIDVFHTQDVWGSGGSSTAKSQSKDAFSDLWGDFQ